jgi:flagellar basal body-associated protein FliL
MAKEKEKDKAPEEVNGQEPEKPVKKAKSLELKLPVVLGIIAAVLLILIVTVRFVFLPYIVHSLTPDVQAKESLHSESTGSEANKSDVKKNGNEELEIFKANEKLSQFVQTGRITTNPKQSTQYVVADFGIIFLPKDEESLKALHEGGGEESKGNGLPPKLSSRVKGIINSLLGSMTVEELQIKRDSVPLLVKANLKPFFKQQDLFVKEVILQEFIIQ